MKKKDLQVAIYNRAVQRNSWSTLIPYPILLFSWQAIAGRKGDGKTVKAIAAVASHKLGYQCSTICKGPFTPGHGHHKLCKPDCSKINAFMKKSLTKQLVEVLQRKVKAGQQLLLDNN